MDASFVNGTRDGAVVVLEGEIDMSTAPAIADRVQAAVDAGAGDLTVDLAAVTFMDSEGLYALFEAQAAITARGGRFALRSPSKAVRSVLDLAGLDARLPMQP